MAASEGGAAATAGAGAAAAAGGAGTAASAAPAFVGDAHARFIVAADAATNSYEYVVTEHLRMSGIYWGYSALVMLRREAALPRDGIIDFVRACRRPGGGYAGNAGHDAHLLYTLSALQLLALSDALGTLTAAEVAETAAYIKSLQRADGAFAGDCWGEIDTRFSYCALQSLALLGRLRVDGDGAAAAAASVVVSDDVDVPRAVEFIVSCRNFDGGFGAVPGAESHAGQIFCCVAALAIAGALHHVDADLLGWWLAERQCDSGGLNGRPEKQADVCYSWWILSAMTILGRISWIDAPALARFILECQDPEGGGIADRPGNMADIYHTYFGIAGLSLLQHPAVFHAASAADADSSAGAATDRTLIDAVYALPLSLVKSLRLPRQVLPDVGAARSHAGAATT